MNKRLLSVLVFALAISAIASVVLYRLISTKLAASAKGSSMQVAVASHDLVVGTLIKDSDLRVVDWRGPEPKGALVNAPDLIGRGVVATIYESEPILDNRLAPKGAGAGLAATIPKGMRAVAVRVNDVVGVAGFVLPGMRVDILIAGNPPGAATGLGTQTRTLFQNIEVLSAGQDIQKDSEGKPVNAQVVNLLVTPEQAETLSLASNETRIQLVLRNPLDTDNVKTPGTTIAKLFPGGVGVREPGTTKLSAPQSRPRLVAETKPVPAVAAPIALPVQVVVPVTVEVIRGSARDQVKVQPDNRTIKGQSEGETR
ncbi:MAG TPA: Flp pilus assembly protein CpaB [Bryobacteraceae bacterium]|nr:Flp pilus assembly protein CpaB [Bryobacteraceae bacterium]